MPSLYFYKGAQLLELSLLLNWFAKGKVLDRLMYKVKNCRAVTAAKNVSYFLYSPVQGTFKF